MLFFKRLTCATERCAIALEHIAKELKAQHPVSLSLVIERNGTMSDTLTVGDPNVVATMQFSFNGTAEAGPNDSVSGAPIAPVLVSSDETIATVAASVAGSAEGQWTAAITLIGPGSVTFSVNPLTNSDGSPVTSAVTLPTPQTVTVNLGAANELSLSISG